MTVSEYDELRKKIALEIMEIFKSNNLSVSLIDDVLEETKDVIHRNAHL